MLWNFIMVIISAVLTFLIINFVIPMIRFINKKNRAVNMHNAINAVINILSESGISTEDVFYIELEFDNKLQTFKSMNEAYSKLELLVNDAFEYYKRKMNFINYITGDMDIFIAEKRDLIDILSEARTYNWKHKGITQN